MSSEKLFQAGPDRPLRPVPGDMKLKDGQPSINLFLADKAVISHTEHEEASDKLRAIAFRRPEEFSKLSDMSFADAKAEAARLLADVEAEDEELTRKEAQGREAA